MHYIIIKRKAIPDVYKMTPPKMRTPLNLYKQGSSSFNGENYNAKGTLQDLELSF